MIVVIKKTCTVRVLLLQKAQKLQNISFCAIVIGNFGFCLLKQVFYPVNTKMRIIFMTKKLVKTLLVALSFLLIASNTTFASQSPQNAKQLIVKTAQKMGVDPYIALSIAKIESNFNTSIKSPGGAIGLYQLTPSTAKKLGVNPYIVSENIEGGLRYYQMLYKKYGSIDLALAAYNAGPGNVAKYNGIPPFTSTKNFIKNIKKEYNGFKADSSISNMI